MEGLVQTKQVMGFGLEGSEKPAPHLRIFMCGRRPQSGQQEVLHVCSWLMCSSEAPLI